MSDGRVCELYEIEVGDLLRRHSIAEIEEEDQDVAFAVVTVVYALQCLDHIGLNQLLRVCSDHFFPLIPNLIYLLSGVERLDISKAFLGMLAAQPVNRHAGPDVHQVDLGFDFSSPTEALERAAFIIKNLEVSFLKEIGGDLLGGDHPAGEPP